MVKHPPTMQETQVQSLGQEDSLEKDMATHSSTLVWKISWMEKCGRLQSKLGSFKCNNKNEECNSLSVLDVHLYYF